MAEGGVSGTSIVARATTSPRRPHPGVPGAGKGFNGGLTHLRALNNISGFARRAGCEGGAVER
jgi:hypothetical protein